MQPAPQDNQLMSKHRVLSLKPQLRLEWRGQDGQSETEQPDHSASLGDSITSSTRIRFSVHTRTLAGAVCSRSDLANVAAELLRALFPMKKAVRLLGVSVSGFVGEETEDPTQMPLEL
jgi:hypothetical protein